jgi:predicted DCC family thiol-disulfide oxidoreductase YuxK
MADPRLKVYYNSACPVCDAGIRGQRGRMRDCGAAVEWVDIHHDAQAVEEIGARRELVRERLHVQDAAGQVHIGADAFAELWSHTPRWRWLGALLRRPVIRPAANWCYDRFAAALYAWNRRRKRWRVEGE